MSHLTDPDALADVVVSRLRSLTRPARARGVAAETPTAQECLGLTVGDIRTVVREFAPDARALSPSEALGLALAIIQHGTFDGRQCAYELLAKNRPAMAALRTRSVTSLGRGIDNWNSVDAFACGISGPVWGRGGVTDAAVLRWAQSRDPWWRRAALASTVALNLPSRGGTGDVVRTLRVCELVIEDEHITVRKALSWALRTLVRVDRSAVESFLAEHEAVLPALVLRETRRKLSTGRKNG